MSLGIHLDRAVAHACDHGKSDPDGIDITVFDVVDCIGNRRLLLQTFLRYVFTGQQCFSDAAPYFYAAAHDEATVGGVTLQNLFWTVPRTNVAILAAPAVPWVKPRRGE